MALSLTPGAASFFPGFPRWTDMEREIDCDIARMHRMVNQANHRLQPDREGVHHRQPNYSYKEDDHHAHIEVELPGVAKENVTIDLQGESLSITAARHKRSQQSTMEPSEKVQVEHAKPISAGKPAQQMDDTGMKPDTLPVSSDPEKKQETGGETLKSNVSVKYHLHIPVSNKFDLDNIAANMPGDGILNVLIPKRTAASGASRMIEIGTGST